MGKGRRRGHIRLGPGGVVLGRRGEPGCLGRGRSLAPDRWQARGRPGGAGRPLEWPGQTGPGRGRFGGPCRAARQAELAAQARPGARAVLGLGPVTSGPCRAWAVPGRPCSGRANGPRAVSSSIFGACVVLLLLLCTSSHIV